MEEKKKLSFTAKMILGCVAVLILIILIMLLLSIKPTIRLNKYVTISFDGYDTVGKATAEVDYGKIVEDYGKKIKSGNELTDYAFEIALYAVASGSLDKREGLSNGDTVTYTWNVTGQKEFESTYGVKLSYKDITETVSGLEKANVYDPFSDVKVTFEGISSLGRASVEVSGASVKGLTYQLSKESGLRNGDEVKLVVSAPYGRNLEEYCLTYGYIPGETEKTYTVSGLQEAQEFDPFESVEVVFEGYSAIGTAKLETGKAVVDGLSYTVEPKQGLSNGDTVTVTVTGPYGQDIEEYCLPEGYVPAATEKTYEVSGLEEAKELDPFESIEVIFTGTEPDGRASVQTDKAEIDGLVYELDKDRGLHNEDEVKVTVRAPWGGDLEQYCIERGYVLTKTEQTYTVEGLTAYVSKLETIDEDALDAMDEQAMDAFDAYRANHWEESESMKSCELLGNYFLTVKDPTAYSSTKNYLYFVYEVEVSNKDGKFTYYYTTWYENIMVLGDGTLSYDLSAYSTPRDQFKKGSYYYNGYEKLDTLFSKCVTAKADTFTYESTVETEKEDK